VRAVKLGRNARKFSPKVPHMSALRALRLTAPAPPPVSVDWTTILPKDLGVMLNDQLGDCTCAAIYHARQVFSANSNPPIDTESDAYVQQVYEQACGYKAGNPATDQGGNEQEVLTYWLNVGVPVSGNPPTDRLLAFLEVDVKNTDDIKRAINECGVVYIGITCPTSLINDIDNGSIPQVWDIASGDSLTSEGHAIILAGYDSIGPTLISWGQVYKMTWEFFNFAVDEAYALADAEWISAKGTSPGGLTVQQLEEQMQALKES